MSGSTFQSHGYFAACASVTPIHRQHMTTAQTVETNDIDK